MLRVLKGEQNRPCSDHRRADTVYRTFWEPAQSGRKTADTFVSVKLHKKCGILLTKVGEFDKVNKTDTLYGAFYQPACAT